MNKVTEHNGVSLASLKADSPALTLNEIMKKKALEKIRRIIGLLQATAAFLELNHGTDMTSFGAVIPLRGALVQAHDLGAFPEVLYERYEATIFCQKGRPRRVFFVEVRLTSMVSTEKTLETLIEHLDSVSAPSEGTLIPQEA